MSDEVWVAVRLSYADGSGKTVVIGAYSSEVEAQAACWRHHDEQPATVVCCTIDDDRYEVCSDE